MRTSATSSGRRRTVLPPRSSDPRRVAAERAAGEELEAWRERAIPVAHAPLEADDLVQLLRDCVVTLGLSPAITADFTVATVHYYRRKDIIDPPDGRTAAARYDIRHVWQIAAARLAGYLGLVTLAEARTAMRGMGTSELLDFLAARVVDARARSAVRAAPGNNAARPLHAAPPPRAIDSGVEALMIPLTGDAWCVIPRGHAAHLSPDAARELVDALAAAFRLDHTR
jgi:hypothetical protein